MGKDHSWHISTVNPKTPLGGPHLKRPNENNVWGKPEAHKPYPIETQRCEYWWACQPRWWSVAKRLHSKEKKKISTPGPLKISFWRGECLKKDHRLILEIVNFCAIFPLVHGLSFQLSEIAVVWTTPTYYYAQRMARFTLVSIDFILDTGRFLCLHLVTGLKTLKFSYLVCIHFLVLVQNIVIPWH